MKNKYIPSGYTDDIIINDFINFIYDYETKRQQQNEQQYINEQNYRLKHCKPIEIKERKYTKPNYNFKSYVMSLEYNGQLLIDVMRKLSLSLAFPNNEFSYSREITYQIKEDIYNTYDIEIIKECEKINHSYYEKTKRLKERVKTMITDNECIFLTLTFNNEILDTTNADTRKQYIRKFLKQFNCPYIANIDFGKADEYIDENGELRNATHREHYHALLQIDKIDLKLYKYGIINVQKVKRTSEPVKLAKYIAKLTNHAVKETVKRNSIIYSR